MIFVNGDEQQDAATVAALLERLGLGEQARGVAVAIDGEVVPRSEWRSAALAPGTRVEVVGAIQGG
ncbi:MAG TPA: sulfur carrier protein ThiS [Solirubrobacteraceae bacterium]|nr:sulfur carrier protein ThiS [Solirubrobacteraceae bacterium]